jgi:accessory colonization factor AcfC
VGVKEGVIAAIGVAVWDGILVKVGLGVADGDEDGVGVAIEVAGAQLTKNKIFRIRNNIILFNFYFPAASTNFLKRLLVPS